MKRTYTCPHCDAILNPSVKIILRATLKGQTGLVLLSPRPGNYALIVPEGFPLKPEDRVELSCPACGKDLTSPRGAEWAEVGFATSPEHEGSVVFSKIYGRHATYFITREEIRFFGEDARDSANFFGEGPRMER